MAIDNFISIRLSQSEFEQMDHLLTDFEALLKDKFISLTPVQRMEYSRVGNKTADWISRVKDYMGQYPDLVLHHIDTAEFNADFEVRNSIMPRLRRLQAITSRLDDTALLLGGDLYHNAISYYKGIKTAAKTNAPNAATVYNDLSSQFPGRPNSKKRKK